MTAFQMVALIVLALLLVACVVGVLYGRLSRRSGALWSIVWLAAGLAITWPASTRIVAQILGIGRGADLVLYCLAIVTMIGFFMTYLRLRRIESSLTTVVRHLALQSPRLPEGSTSRAPA